MKGYLSLIQVNLRLALRERIAIFFNYIFPLIFFFAFGQLMHAGQGGAITQIVTMVLVIGILGNGLFGGGIRAVQDREMNVLRRFKVAPISPTPILVASIATGWALYMPAVILTLALARIVYGMEVPDRWLSLLVLVSLGVVAFRAVGLIIAAVANSAQESQVLVQLVYLPMLFLTGTTFPITLLPAWLQVLTQFLPATYLVTALQGVMLRRETALENWGALAVLATTAVVATFLAGQLFRWEKEEKLRGTAKLWLLAMVVPSLVLGGYHAYSREEVSKTRALYRDMQRSRSVLIRGARIVAGDGQVIESGSILIRGGKIAEIYDGAAPDADELRAEAVEAAGKTVLPGLIDADVHLALTGGISGPGPQTDRNAVARRELAAYLYSGVVAVRSSGDPLPLTLGARKAVAGGERLGAETFVYGSVSGRSEPVARKQVDALALAGVDGVEAALAAAASGAARAHGLPVVVRSAHGGDAADAVQAGANGILDASPRDRIPTEVFQRMARAGIAFLPALSAEAAVRALAVGSPAPLDRSLVQQVGPPSLIRDLRTALASPALAQPREQLKMLVGDVPIARDNLLCAWRAGVMLVTGSAAGSPLVLHGPTVQREMELWVEAGVPPRVALEAATTNAARLLGAGGRIGAIRKSHEASFVIVDGNPLDDIWAAERISAVVFKGERIGRPELFEQE
jgi:imidazolonepropionase-like amidohydrolase/ABC-type multidrug transport system permease subunit